MATATTPVTSAAAAGAFAAEVAAINRDGNVVVPDTADGSTQHSFADTPGDGLGFVYIDTTPDIAPMVFPSENRVFVRLSTSSSGLVGAQSHQAQVVRVETMRIGERAVILRVLSPSNEIVEDVVVDQKVLDDLAGLFRELPDGHYQVYLIEVGEQRIRLIVDVQIREGKATDAAEGMDNHSSNTQPEESRQSALPQDPGDQKSISENQNADPKTRRITQHQTRQAVDSTDHANTGRKMSQTSTL